MSEQIQGAEPAPAQVDLPADIPQAMNYHEAGRILAAARKAKAEAAKAPEAQSPTAVNESLQKAQAAIQESPAPAEDAAPPEPEVPGETQAAEPEPQEAPPIEPPRSWTKEARERWQSLPRETQEYLANREQERDREVRRSQNEAAEKLKGLSAKEQAAEQARQQYEAALPQLVAALQAQTAGEFADIKTIADVEKLAREDWPRYLQWDLAQKKQAAAMQELQAAQQRQIEESRQKFADFSKREDELFAEKAPEMADSEQGKQLQDKAVQVLKDVGFSDNELSAAWQGMNGLSLRDHRMQLLVRDAVKWRDAEAKSKQVQAKPLPPVQRPGVSQGKGAQVTAHIQNLSKQLESATGVNAVRIATDLMKARRAATR